MIEVYRMIHPKGTGQAMGAPKLGARHREGIEKDKHHGLPRESGT